MNYKKYVYTSLSLLAVILPWPTFAQGLVPVRPPEGVTTGPLIPTIINIIDIALTFIGLLAVIMIIFGGLRFIISAGDPDAAGAAKNTILYAIIGLIVIGLSAALVNFIIGVIQTT